MIITVQRLYIRDLLKLLLLLALGLSLFFSIIGLIDKVDDFMPHKPSFALVAEYTLLAMPLNTHYLLPTAILLSSIFTFSQAIRRREIIAIKASGGRMKGILKPFLGIGLILTLFAFILGEVIVPTASKKRHELYDTITGKGKNLSFRDGVMYMRGKEGEIVRISLYLPEEKKALGVSILSFTPSGLRERIDAETAFWTGDGWRLTGITAYDIGEGKIHSEKEMRYTGIASPTILQSDLWKVEEMTLPDLIRYNRRLNEAGFRNPKMLVDISSRISYPLVNLFMLLLGIALSLESRVIEEKLGRVLPSQRGEGKKAGGFVSAGLGLVISLAYWFGYSLFLSLGYAGTVPPVIAPWIIPAVYGLISFYLYRHIPE
ncbi:MAG: LptF/LptG family permease [Thermodesulfovibrionales bacterium]|jgi:lipopolysaccharide export system permease protein